MVEDRTGMNPQFAQEWSEKITRVRASHFWHQVSTPPAGSIERSGEKPRSGEIEVDNGWTIVTRGDLEADGPARIGIDDLRNLLQTHFSITPRSTVLTSDSPCILFEYRPRPDGQPVSRWDASFILNVEPGLITVRAVSEHALLRASLYLSNYWRIRRNPYLPLGRRTVKPAVPLHIGADLWGGFNTTQAWVHGRETDTNFLELARMGINAVPIMTLIEDYIDSGSCGGFQSLINPQAGFHRARLAQLARQSARYGVSIMLMGYNPKLAPDHTVFSENPASRGAIQWGGAFRTLCTSDPATREFLVSVWASLFREIPELGGILAIVGGEGFYHCFMRSHSPDDCPRCSRRAGSEVVAELVNDVARGVHVHNRDARIVTWPYSATHWSHDRDQVQFIERLDPDAVIFQTEIDKDSVDWRTAGYGKNIWDYSMSRVTTSDRCHQQRKHCRARRLRFSCKIECNNSIECLNVPYLPTLENQLRIWQHCRQLRPEAIHSRWLFDGSCKSPSEELGFWAIWGKNTECEDLNWVLDAIARRDFGSAASVHVRKAWRLFSEALCHHPALDYYVGSYFIGPGQPLVLQPEALERLDPAFFGQFYWQWETAATGDASSFTRKKPLFYAHPGFRALARRGRNRGQDVALQELQTMAALWEQGTAALKRAGTLVPERCRMRFTQEWRLGQHLAYTWRSAAHVEEFLRLRDTIMEFSGSYWLRSGHHRENLRDLARMREIAMAELQIARDDLTLIEGVDFLDLSLRLDMGVASTEEILRAKIRQLEQLIASELPEWQERLLQW